MIGDIIGTFAPGPPGTIEWLVILVVSVIAFGIPVLLVVLFVRYVLRSNRERRRLRLELGKLADELEQMRKQAKGDEKDDSSGKSG